MSLQSFVQKGHAVRDLIASTSSFKEDSSLRVQFMDTAFEFLEEIRNSVLRVGPNETFEYDRDEPTGTITLRTAFIHVKMAPLSLKAAKEMGSKFYCIHNYAVLDMDATQKGLHYWYNLNASPQAYANMGNEIRKLYVDCKNLAMQFNHGS